jgi:uncharacterized membrane protein
MFKRTKVISAFISASLMVSPLFYIFSGQLPALSEAQGSSISPLETLPPAYLKICNRTNSNRIAVAIAQMPGRTWQSRGWWNPEPNTCLTIALGKYEGEVLFYAQSDDGKIWDGNKPICIMQGSRFNLSNIGNCSGEVVRMRSRIVKRGQTLVVPLVVN